MQKLFGRALTVIAVILCLHAVPAAAAGPTGTWLTQQGDARVRVSQCGKGICGTIVWLKEPIERPRASHRSTIPIRRSETAGSSAYASLPCSRTVRTNGPAGFTTPTTAAPPPRLPCPRRRSSEFRAVPVRCVARRRGRRAAASQRRPLLSRSSSRKRDSASLASIQMSCGYKYRTFNALSHFSLR